MKNSSKSTKHNHAVVVNYLLSLHRPTYHSYPLNEPDDRIIIDNMYNSTIERIKDKLGEELDFAALYNYFLGQDVRVMISTEDRKRCEEMCMEEFEEMKKQLNDDLPSSFQNWEKRGEGFRHFYKIFGEYCSEQKRIVLYVDNIKSFNEGSKDERLIRNHTLKTYVHELFHVFFHFVTEQSIHRKPCNVIVNHRWLQIKYNYILEIEEALAELCTLIFIEELLKKDDIDVDVWEETLDYAKKEIRSKQNEVGNLAAYGFGAYLYENLNENERFELINSYIQKLGNIDESDAKVREYKQKVRLSYYVDGNQEHCLKLLQEILKP